MLKLFILIAAVLLLGSRMIPALSWVLAFFILLMTADLVRREVRQRFGRHRNV